MIPIRKKLESHIGQGVVWSSQDGPVRGWIEYPQVTYKRNGEREVVFVVSSHKGDRCRKKTQHMLYPNVTAWCRHKVELLEVIRKLILERKGIDDLYKRLLDALDILWSCKTSPEGIQKFMEILNDINERAYTLLELKDPIEEAGDDAEMLARIDELIARYTKRQRERDAIRKSHESWLRVNKQ